MAKTKTIRPDSKVDQPTIDDSRKRLAAARAFPGIDPPVALFAELTADDVEKLEAAEAALNKLINKLLVPFLEEIYTEFDELLYRVQGASDLLKYKYEDGMDGCECGSEIQAPMMFLADTLEKLHEFSGRFYDLRKAARKEGGAQ